VNASVQRAYGDPIAHSLGLHNTPVIRTRALRQSPIGISRLSIGEEQLGMTPAIAPEDSFILALYLTEVPHHELWSHGRLALSQGYAASSMRIVNLLDEYAALITCPHESLVFYAPRIALDEFTDEAARPRIRHFSCKPGTVDPIVAHLGSVLLPAFQRPSEASTLFIDHVTLALFTHLSGLYGGRAGSSVPFAKGGMTRLQANRAKEFLAAHCADDISLLDAARACGLSRSHFTRAFRVAMGLTPHQWLQRYRVDTAKQMLLKSQTSIAEIATACGFADQSHLTRVFSRVVGDSPASWRRRRG
jgi:AraC-like DNA-binding protein